MAESVYKVIELIGTSTALVGRRRQQPQLSVPRKSSGIFVLRRSRNSIS